MKLRLTAILVIAALLGGITLMPAVAGTASAARPVGNTAALSGTLPTAISNLSGQQVGTLNSITVTGFQVINGVLSAVGTANVTPTGGTAQNTNFVAPLAPAAGTCPILNLDIGAINLNLLGLVVTTAPIHLNITAVSGPGNLLGNLLCTVAHLLDNPGGALGNLLNRIAGLLNQILGGGVLTL